MVDTSTGATLYTATIPYTGANIQPGGSSSVLSTTFTLPDGGPGVGNIKVTVSVNSNSAEAEYNTAGTAGNNNSSSINFTSTLANYADLIVTAGSLALAPASPQSGGAEIVTWSDKNQGDGAVNAAFNDYVLVQKVVGSNYTTIASGYVGGNATLAAGATSGTQSFPFTLPDGASGVGNFVVTVTTDSGQTIKEYDSNGNPAYTNNTSTVNFTSTLANYADLIVATGSLTVTPVSPQSGGSAVVTWLDKNQGDGAVNASFNDYVLVQKVVGSTYTTIASGYVDGNATLAAGATSGTQSFPFTLPDGASGVGNLVVTVTTDYGQTVKEYDGSGNSAYANNTSSTTATSTLANYADLIVSTGSLIVTPASPQSGNTETVTWSDKNQGDGAVNAAFNDYVLVQKVVGSTYTTIASGYVGGNAALAAGATSGTQSFSFVLPDGASGVGNLVVTVTTDSGQTAKEFDSSGNPAYSNNTSSINATSTLANYADLVVAASSLAVTPTSPQSGNMVTVTWSDKNQGDGAVNTAFNDYVLGPEGRWFDLYHDCLGLRERQP